MSHAWQHETRLRHELVILHLEELDIFARAQEVQDAVAMLAEPGGELFDIATGAAVDARAHFLLRSRDREQNAPHEDDAEPMVAPQRG